MKFTELKLNDKLMKGIHDAGFVKCMPVQEETLVHTLKGRDVTAQSQTGTGKTAAFLITIFQLFLEKNGPIKKKKALIIAPTRELAIQIEKEAKLLGRYLDFTIGCFYGGVGYHQQEMLLEDDVDIIIGTPGRLLDFSYQKKLDFKKVGFVVIDEADRLFDMGFLPDIRKMLRRLDPRSKRQTMLFSATLDVETRSIAREFMVNPATVEIMPEQVTVDKITQVLYHVAEKEKINLMLGILKKEMPRNALIFTNMKHVAAQVAKNLEHNGYKCLYLSGDLPQSKRLRVINSFKEGKLPFLVATDVAARGLHIDDLEMIINYDLPGDCENYVHRIGRTARAGKSGKAVSFACEKYVYNLEAIETFIGMKIPLAFAEDEMYHENKGEGIDFRRPARKGKKGPTRSREKTPRGKASARDKTSTRSGKPSAKKREETEGKAKGKKKRTGAEKKSVPQAARTASRKEHKDHREPGDRRHPAKKKSKPRGKSTGGAKKRSAIEDRLEYYKKKYGDNFMVQPEPGAKSTPSPEPKKSFIKRIAGFFKRGKR